MLFRVLCEEVIIKTNMTIRLLSLLATLNKAVKAEPPVTLTLLATLKEVEEEIKQGLVALQLSLILHECSAVSTFSQQGWRRVLYQVTNVKVKYTTPRGSKRIFAIKSLSSVSESRVRRLASLVGENDICYSLPPPPHTSHGQHSAQLTWHNSIQPHPSHLFTRIFLPNETSSPQLQPRQDHETHQTRLSLSLSLSPPGPGLARSKTFSHTLYY